MRIDTIIESERVFTGGDAVMPAAVAISGDRIAAIGPREEMRALARETNGNAAAPEVRDFEDALVVPGFHDSRCTSSTRPCTRPRLQPRFWERARPTAWRA